MNKVRLLTALCTIVLIVGLSEQALAISAWARRYGVNCTMCHWRVNRLNETGKEFLRRGHRLPGEGSEVDGKSISIDHYWSLTEKVRYVDNEGVNSKFDVEAFSLYVGGPLDPKFSFFTEQYLHESKSSGADREKLAESYLSYNTTTNDDYTSIRAGQIHPFLLHYHGTGGRLPISRPSVLNDAVASIKVGTDAGGGSLFNTYRPRLRNYGLEVAHNWNKSNIYGAAGVLNGTGHDPANINVDFNNSKDVYLTIEKIFDPQGSSLGFYSYWGEAVTAPGADKSPVAGNPEDSFNRLGFIGNFTRNDWAVIAGYIWGSDDFFTSGVHDGDIDNHGYFVEYERLVGPVWSAYARYDYVQPDDNDRIAGDNSRRGPTVGVSAWMSKYSRISAEWQNLKDGGAESQRTFIIEGQWMY